MPFPTDRTPSPFLDEVSDFLGLRGTRLSPLPNVNLIGKHVGLFLTYGNINKNHGLIARMDDAD